MREDIAGTLQNLRAYRSQDPGSEADIERAAEAEASMRGDHGSLTIAFRRMLNAVISDNS